MRKAGTAFRSVIRQRFAKSVDYFEKHYKAIVDEWYVWDSLEDEFAFKAVPNVPFIDNGFVVLFEIIDTLGKSLANDALGECRARLAQRACAPAPRTWPRWEAASRSGRRHSRAAAIRMLARVCE